MAQPQKNAKPGFKQEFVAILGLFFAVFMLLSLISEQLASQENWCGEIGRLVAQLLLGFTGWGAYLFAGLVILLSILFFSRRLSFERLPQVTIGLTGAIISFCSLLSAFTLYRQDLLGLGGFLGRTIFTFIHTVLGNSGTILLLALVLLVSMMLAIQFSPYQLLVLVWRTIRGTFGGAVALVRKGFEKRTERKKKIAQREKIKPLPKLEPEPESTPFPSRPVVKEQPEPAASE
ncbi:MAG: DNA translocase FtsK 4TM domain-containing protein [Desulfocapsaceae bacterium]|jgi:S-DNA-T family DNA segregation ATPase FtsK/SpoIIIE|nr:DNA translocase FtsK 4TM domain-containing protein [Desulfocapsaceae bacterium]